MAVADIVIYVEPAWDITVLVDEVPLTGRFDVLENDSVEMKFQCRKSGVLADPTTGINFYGFYGEVGGNPPSTFVKTGTGLYTATMTPEEPGYGSWQLQIRDASTTDYWYEYGLFYCTRQLQNTISPYPDYD